MKVRLLQGLCLLLVLAACNKNNLLQTKPSDVLSSDQIIPLLVDIHLTDAALKINQPTRQSSDIKLYYSIAYAPVFKKHKTSPAVFQSSMQWYGRHIDKLDEIYAEVITQLSTLESHTRIKVKPNKPGTGGHNPFYPDTDTSYYMPDSLRDVQIPYAIHPRQSEMPVITTK